MHNYADRCLFLNNLDQQGEWVGTSVRLIENLGIPIILISSFTTSGAITDQLISLLNRTKQNQNNTV